MTAPTLDPATPSATTTGTGVRLLGATPDGPVPLLDLAALLAVVEQAGLTGRGGAGFPTARKVRAVAAAAGRRRRPVVVGNAMEGEPLSRKDAALLGLAPGLVLDGLDVVAHALGTRDRLLAVGPEVDDRAVRAAASARSIAVRRLPGGFVAGQESAVVAALGGRPGVPRDPAVRVGERGLDGRPTLVLNAETLAHVALVARHGAAAYRAAAPQLLTISGTGGAIRHPGVLEVPRGTPLVEVIRRAGGDPTTCGPVLLGGYHGTWLAPSQLGIPVGDPRTGAGVVHVLDATTCPVRATADIARWLADQSARQCGPCVNGLPHLAATLGHLADAHPDPRLEAEVARVAALVDGRGACAHPDGTVRMVRSAWSAFGDHVRAHLAGHCPTPTSTPHPSGATR
ncbi:NADH-ubiquinone oxidoreductase-F iron-sulfur binding region domain-containing protein [Nocardioides sp.]|uniref:NADH-ubiquinone oxidoreductase-F iron-sulfur binding region domain-containing protein n=1 Tax=Nocardioides sp. TaxID=35761 RepID=UPI003519448E